MAKQANRIMIGGFVVVAVFLLAASIVVFGSGRLFKKTNLYLMYFEDSVKGLAVGSPVLFRGVPIGTVKSLTLRTNPKKKMTEIPIIVEVEPGQFEVVGVDEAPLIVTLERSLQEITQMARAFRELAAYLERHPEALLRGKGSELR